MRDPFIMSCDCQDDSYVEYKIEDGIRMVYQTFPNGTQRKARYDDGKWEYTF